LKLSKTKKILKSEVNEEGAKPFFIWPGRIVNFLTFKKGIDFFQKMSIIIIVKGRVRLDKRRLKVIHWQASPQDK